MVGIAARFRQEVCSNEVNSRDRGEKIDMSIVTKDSARSYMFVFY